ncbi:MAG: sigma-54-dependent Fis family transcriptional regulator [Nitrospirae bacterium]|nr:MAG: sigma-54-dependent Fis family transcriptional regulator [Nitrospirota bacterium]
MEQKRDRRNTVLIVDDERDICRALEFILSRDGHVVDTANSGEEAVKKIEKKVYDLVITDLRMEGIDGIALLEEVKKIDPATIVVIMTAYASVENAVKEMKKGASDYIVKPFVNEDVKLTVRRLLEHKRLQMENVALRRQISQQMGCTEFVGDSPQMRRIFDLLEKVIPTRSNVLLLGESGTGKGMIAELIHCNSPRRESPFMTINCSAIPETLLESELFGYKKGAFTGATDNKDGLFKLADGGTLFLDEIGDMPLSLQSKILKVIETGEVFPLGGKKPVQTDVRLIAATNKNLAEMVEEGRFREDLYYRLNVIEINIPPLRERPDDIPLLARYFLDQYSAENRKPLRGISKEAMDILISYPWFGNVRELRNVIERAVVLSEGDEIRPEDLPDSVRFPSSRAPVNLKELVSQYEKKIIVEKLSEHNWDKEETARHLGIDLATLYRKIKRLGIEGVHKRQF